MKSLASASMTLVAILILAMIVLPVNESQALVVSAPASMTEVLTALKPEAERHLGLPILLNFGSSGALRSHIEHGARVDVYISAAANHMDRLEHSGLLATGTRRNLLSNNLALIGDSSRAKPRSLEELLGLLASVDRIALGDPAVVPAGGYAIEALTRLGVSGLDGERLILGGSVRQVLSFVGSGSAPLGMVFVSDAVSASAAASGRVEILHVFPADSFPTPVVYPAAAMATSEWQTEAVQLIDFLTSANARTTFLAAGFGVP
jgi:molybdate transport system substrate-binding protein